MGAVDRFPGTKRDQAEVTVVKHHEHGPVSAAVCGGRDGDCGCLPAGGQPAQHGWHHRSIDAGGPGPCALWAGGGAIDAVPQRQERAVVD